MIFVIQTNESFFGYAIRRHLAIFRNVFAAYGTRRFMPIQTLSTRPIKLTSSHQTNYHPILLDILNNCFSGSILDGIWLEVKVSLFDWRLNVNSSALRTYIDGTSPIWNQFAVGIMALEIGKPAWFYFLACNFLQLLLSLFSLSPFSTDCSLADNLRLQQYCWPGIMHS